MGAGFGTDEDFGSSGWETAGGGGGGWWSVWDTTTGAEPGVVMNTGLWWGGGVLWGGGVVSGTTGLKGTGAGRTW